LDASEYDECYDFLTTYMPARDIGNVLDPSLNETIVYALMARQQLPYSASVPWNIFLNNILPYYTLSEPRDNWRRWFYQRLVDNVTQFQTITQAVTWFMDNVETVFDLTFKGDQTPLIMSPFETLTWGFASCTGWSIFTVSAMRSIGIPCRVAGTPQWNEECTGFGGNHDWVEIWDGKYWSFTDAPMDGSSFQYNKTWFYPGDTNCQIQGSLNYSIYATSYQTTPNDVYFVMAWDYDAQYVNGFDVTANYQTNTTKK